MSIRVAVVGATGNVGTAVLRRFAAADAGDVETVLGVARRLPDPGTGPYDGVERWLSCDIGGTGATTALVEGFAGLDAVVLLAWALQPTQAAVRAGVRHILYASSIGTYAAGDKSVRVDETWPATGVQSSQYSRHKAANEAWLDEVAAFHPDLTITRMRPGLVFQAKASSEIARYFLGSVLRTDLLVKAPLPVLPLSRKFVFQAVHADDLAEAFLLATRARAGGAFNIAAEPVLGPAELAGALGGKRVLPVPLGLMRGLAAASWAAHLQPTSPGWIDLAGASPIMDTARARTELGWQPKVSASAALAELVAGFSEHAGHPSPVLEPGKVEDDHAS